MGHTLKSVVMYNNVWYDIIRILTAAEGKVRRSNAEEWYNTRYTNA